MSEQTRQEPYAQQLSGFGEVFDNEDRLVDAVCERFFREHPDYRDRFEKICREDMTQNLRYLACAVEAGEFTLLRAYLLWLRDIFEKRGIPVQHLVESLALLPQELARFLEPDTLAAYRDYAERGMALLETPWDQIPADEPARPGPEALRYLETILSGNRREAQALITELTDSGRGYVDLVADVIQPAMVELGRLWQGNTISVAQEHLATAITQNILAHCLMYSETASPMLSSAVFACVEGNRHNLGLLIIADVFELEGWATHFLGADTPLDSLMAYIRQEDPDLVGLSISLPQHVLQVKRIVEEIRAEGHDSRPVILVGGHFADKLSPLLLDYGVDAVCGSVRDCLRYARP